jgi:hypothetical protein
MAAYASATGKLIMMERQDFFAAMTDAMRGGVRDAAIAAGIPAGTVKARILEAHAPERSPDGVGHLIHELSEQAGLQAECIGDDLWRLRGSDASFFLDTLNPRFWILETTAPSPAVDGLMRRHFLRDSRIDRAWLPRQQLDALEGTRLWMRSSFRSDRLSPPQGAPARRWRFQVEGEDPERALALLAQDATYGVSAALSAVGAEIHEPPLGRARVTVDYHGAFSADGESFEVVQGVLFRTVRRYERLIESLERRHQLRFIESECGLQLEGEVFVLPFRQPIKDLDAFLAGLFSCREPFRLWAVPRAVGSDCWEANAVDLHVGQPIRLEISARCVRVLLRENTCANTVARLVVNLQHHLDARLALTDESNLLAS